MADSSTQAERNQGWVRAVGDWRHPATALAALVVFVALGLAVARSPLLPGEEATMRVIQALPWSLFGTPMVLVSALGYQPYSGLVSGGAFLFFLWRRLNPEAVAVAIAVSGSLVSSAVKELVGRVRPSPDLYHVYRLVGEPSFPSGHVVFYTALFGFLFYLLWTLWRPSLPRGVGMTITGALVLLVGLSRLYLGAHFPTDVLGGYVLGGLWLAATIAVYHRLELWPANPPLGRV
ncbi:MAG: phosphatase PAP2 family protein [Chloroflexota bacterium]